MLVPVSRTAKIAVISVAVGATLVGFLARYLGRRRRAAKSRNPGPDTNRKSRPSGFWRNLNGDVPQRRTSSVSPLPPRLRRHGSVSWCSECQSTHASSATLTPDGPSVLGPQQLGVMGMEALDTAIAYWEEALTTHARHDDDPQGGEPEFARLVEGILDAAYDLREQCSHLFLFENSVVFRHVPAAPSGGAERSLECDHGTVSSVSSAESFVSAHGEIGDIRDFEEFGDLAELSGCALYQAGLKQAEASAVPCRILRTSMLRCQSDTEYLAKVHCVRLAFQYLLEKEEERSWFANAGSQLLTGLLLYGEKDPKDCLVAYEEMLRFVEDKANWPMIEEELGARGVKCMSFYDIVLDFIILDGFDDLENPPSVVTAVAKNRWLSYGFKETALATAVWSVLKAKRRIMKFPNGFISHSYDIFEHLSPVLAWGFLGPDEELKEVCTYFKDEVLGFVQDIFSAQVVRYTRVEDLAADISSVVRARYDKACRRMQL